METLQKRIEERAIKKLNEDLNFIGSILNGYKFKYYHLLGGININLGSAEKPENINVGDIFSSRERIYKEAYANNLPKYIEAETKLFLEEIETLKHKVEGIEDELGGLFH